MRHRPRSGALARLALGSLLSLSTLPAAHAAVSVVTTTTDLAAITREVGGTHVEVTSLAAGSQDPHFVDAKPSFLVKLKKADLFVEVGLELETGWAPNLVANSRNAAIQKGAPGFVDASEGCTRLNVPGQTDRSAGDIHPFGNPHYWLDPANGKVIARNVAEGLKRVDAANAAHYDKGLAAFTAKLDLAIARWATESASLKGVPVVAYHDSWPYLQARFGFEVVAFIEPKPGIPPSGKYVAELVKTMKERKVGIIVNSPFYDAKTADLVARESGARIVTLAPSVEGIPEATDYLALFEANLRILRDAAAGK